MTTDERLEWLEQRRSCITGTDIGAIAGLNRWKAPIDVFNEKLGLVDGPEESPAMRIGTLLEDKVARIYAARFGVELEPGAFARHPEREWQGGTPDRLLKGYDRGLEIKVVTSPHALNDWGDEGTDVVPESYHAQADWYMSLHERSEWDVAALFLPTIEPRRLLAAVIEGDWDVLSDAVRVYHLTRNHDLEDALIQLGGSFWLDHIQTEIPPALDGAEGWNGYLLAKFPRNNGLVEIAPPEVDGMIADYLNLKARIEELETQQEEVKVALKAKIADLDGFEGLNGKVLYKLTKDSESTNWEALAGHLAGMLPGGAEELVKLKPQFKVVKAGSRRLTVNPPKAKK